ncbi:MAG: cofactor-independent phosphoglycerate mutase [Bacillota bacterium]|nr:cofactor-independent phosphoglycerate mutase [Bacillota bacterium]
MKYVVILGDGMPDYPLEKLGGKTPLEYARTPNMDRLAKCGEMGTVKSVPQGMPAGSDVANLSVMGYDPAIYYTGRSPIEAVAMGVEMADDDLAFRCNLVTLSDEEAYKSKSMLDYSSGEISTTEAQEIMNAVGKKLGSEIHNFYPGVSYRHLLVWRSGPVPEGFKMTPPHDISGKVITEYLPRGENSGLLLEFMEKSNAFLPEHTVNRERLARGLKPANSIWLWGEGRKPRLNSFREKYGLEGVVISAVDLIKGLGILSGLEAVDLPGATGTITTDFRGKAQRALKELHNGNDFIFVHVEAPDEAGHQGDIETKIKAIEEIDEKVVGEILRGLEDFPEYRLMVLSDHPTPLSLRTHTAEPVPFCIYKKGAPLKNPQGQYSESFAAKGIYIEKGHELMDYFLGQ